MRCTCICIHTFLGCFTSFSPFPLHIHIRIRTKVPANTPCVRSAALSTSARKAQKSSNKKGNPVKLASKILDVAADPLDADAVYVAEAAGTVKRVRVEV